MYFLRILSYVKRVQMLLPNTRKYYTSMDLIFFENKSFLTKNFPQEKRVSEDENIWDVSLNSHKHPLANLL